MPSTFVNDIIPKAIPNCSLPTYQLFLITGTSNLNTARSQKRGVPASSQGADLEKSEPAKTALTSDKRSLTIIMCTSIKYRHLM